MLSSSNHLKTWRHWWRSIRINTWTLCRH